MKKIAIVLSIISFTLKAQPKVSTGAIRHFEDFKSELVTPRNVDVWLPDGYSSNEKYEVLYMHDGQNLYDASANWNKQAWEADSISGKLIRENKTRKFIIVGISNIPLQRFSNYFPQKAFESLTRKTQDSLYALEWNGTKLFSGPVSSDAYLKFIVSELKPFIDKNFSVYPDQKHTFIAGSSMGGLISMYAVCEYPNIFGGAACLSTHWPGTFEKNNNPIPAAFFNYLKNHLPNPASNRFYFDYGDQTLDALYPPLQAKADEVMKLNGFNEVNWITKYYPGADHSENSWQKRFEIPLVFLLGK
ncbi:alpha/beta hydrolase-fold protein [Flavobacterium sp.]|uniref:alpha/beta hydrolase n=1 Tax=Flavobacterium sp. TaxID=239 RepID=UPI00261C6BF3|nr:alpha/beta hydrolase-fold protein [Flavobacterium sp.]